MIKSLQLLNPHQLEQLALAIQQIAAVSTPQFIYCHAYITKSMKGWYCTEPMTPAKANHDQFDLLVVLREYDLRDLAVLEAQLQALFFHSMRFTYKVMTANQHAQLFLSGDRFSADVYTNGLLLYEGSIPSVECIQRSLGDLAYHIIIDWKATCEMAGQCIVTATRSAHEYHYIAAVLMLYKAAVILTKSIIYAREGKIPRTIELSRLLNICESFCTHGLFLFPRATPDDHKLISRFEYVGRNGRPDPVGPADAIMVQTLIGHTKKLYELAPCLFQIKQST